MVDSSAANGRALNHNSRTLVGGVSRAGARAMFKATGLNDEDLEKPLIAIANTWTEIGPCNIHLRRLATKGEGGHPRRRWHAAGVQHHHNQRWHYDGHGGHEGLAHQPRDDRRLDRAGYARQLLRRNRCLMFL